MMKSGVHIIKDRMKQALDSLRTLPLYDVLVGIPQDRSARTSGEMNNAALGYIHETGAPEANIPERAFLRPGIADAKERIVSYLRQAAKAATTGEVERIRRAFHAAGLVAQSAVRKRIDTGPFEPLKPSTLRRRRRHGRTGEKPLIDTGQLRNAITYVVRLNK